ncbi:hypothetical protein AQUCO_04300026v1 [Aquilegia coerulea]|uniref:APO domain-containing protein n=1 Tax=Aquilegia coerulea TaxID=218851 RepID=A0A2G5CND1_AQUCA|nr:hypothetical protein AQUCO_04300026v1 [Aquilegia coerulea]PIA32815.1 hypothetical protein AQUCO_04300026v1 [Aquilegia coerulea]
MQRSILYDNFNSKRLYFRLRTISFYAFVRTLNIEADGVDPLYTDVPTPFRKKSERKPYPTPMKVLIRRAKQVRAARKAQPCKIVEEAPQNGLLIPELVEVAQRVYRARGSLLHGLWDLVNVVVPVKRCRFCSEVHIGNVGHEIRTCSGPKSGLRSATHVWRQGGIEDVVYFPECFHLYDRIGKPRVVHDERSRVPRIPAIVELCIQAGLVLHDYPAKRRTKPVYSIEGRIVDFGSETEDEYLASEDLARVKEEEEEMCLSSETGTANKVLESWFEMVSGAKKLMKKYQVWTCGYCPEVQVGPKGHKVRMCRASKHQSRNGLHAWQEATMDDFIGPNYVWHVNGSSSDADLLVNELKRYYGKAPAVVELCVKAGAPVPDEYRSMMRLDVVPPAPDEADLVA